MTFNNLEKDIGNAVPKLLDMARELTWNKLSDNCKFILTEIKDTAQNFHEQRRLRKKENDQKIPVTLQEIVPTLQELYDNFYDINLFIYKSTKNRTVINIRYYPKSSLDKEFSQEVINNPPMLHCKVAMPPWFLDKKEKFDINWEHYIWWNEWKLFLLRIKLETHKR